MFHPIYGIRSLDTIPLYVIMAVLALCFGLLLKQAYNKYSDVKDLITLLKQ